MTRLVTTGLETRRYTTSKETHGEGQNCLVAGTEAANIAIDTTNQWSGATAMKLLSGKQQYHVCEPTFSKEQWYYHAPVVRLNGTFGSGSYVLNGLWVGSIETVEVFLNSSGEVGVFFAAGAENVLSGFKPELNKYYIYELGAKVSTNESKLRIRDSSGVVKFEQSYSKSLGTSAFTKAIVGNAFAVSAESLISQVILNNGSGEKENSFPGPQKVVYAKPISDKSRIGWVNGGGGTTELFTALDNFPPTGSASSTNGIKIKDAENNTTDTYQANLQTYNEVGIPETNLIKTITGIFRISNSLTTSRNAGLKLISNPESAEVIVGTITTAVGTDPSGWTTGITECIYEPSVTRGISPVLQIRKATASTDTLAVDMGGIYISYALNSSYIRLSNDTLSTSDAVTRSTGPVRSISDAIVLSETPSRAFTGTRKSTETLSTSDSITAPKTVSRSSSDATSISDSNSRTIGIARNPNESLLLTDANSRSFIGTRKSTETLSTSDSVLGVKTVFKNVSELLSTSDTVSRATAITRAISQPLVTSDSVTRVFSGARSIAQALTTSDAVTRSIAFTRAKAEALSTSDSPSRQVVVKRSVTDALTTAEAPIAHKSIFRTVVETLSTSDAVARINGGFSRVSFDSNPVSDTAKRIITVFRKAIDLVTGVDSPSVTAHTVYHGELPLDLAISTNEATLRGGKDVASLNVTTATDSSVTELGDNEILLNVVDPSLILDRDHPEDFILEAPSVENHVHTRYSDKLVIDVDEA